MPAYPYISFTVINTDTKKGTYSATKEIRDGKTVDLKYMPLTQKWSFTAQSDKDAEALEKAMLISDFFQEVKRQELADNNIIVSDVGAITPRDNFLTVEYEYRKGLDVTISLNNVIENTVTETINKVVINDNINIEKE